MFSTPSRDAHARTHAHARSHAQACAWPRARDPRSQRPCSRRRRRSHPVRFPPHARVRSCAPSVSDTQPHSRARSLARSRETSGPALSRAAKPLPPGPSAGDLNDLHAYDPASRNWTNLSAPAAGVPPARRDSHGFAASGGLLYVHGGESSNGVRRARTRRECARSVAAMRSMHKRVSACTAVAHSPLARTRARAIFEARERERERFEASTGSGLAD